MLVASLIVIQLFGADRSASKIADRGSLQGRESSQLQACVATPPDSGWYVVEVGDVATVHLPPDARLTTVRRADQNLTPEQRRALSELRGSWMLADYGGIGLSLRPRTESATPKILADSGARAGRGGVTAEVATTGFLRAWLSGIYMRPSEGTSRHFGLYAMVASWCSVV